MKPTRSVSMDLDIVYLLGFLEDDLGQYPDVKITAVAPSGTRKSIDLPQDYDPNTNDVHLSRGVRVRIGSREFFFPDYWVKNGQFDKVRALSDQIKNTFNF
jgi:hypothetical protein